MRLVNLKSVSSKFCILLIAAYRYLLSPVLGNHCRYHPSCSNYTTQAIQRFGCISGIYLGTKRILRCHPWHSGGYDPVPNKSLSDKG